MAHVEDRWMVPGPTGRKIKGPRHGQGSRWLAVWHETDGTRRKKAFRTKDAAEAHLEQVGVDQRAGTYISPARGQIPFADVANDWYAEQIHLRGSTAGLIRRRLDRTILPSLGTTPVAAITRKDVQAAVTSWTDTLAPSTIGVAYSYVVAIFRYAVEERRIAASPCKKINLPAGDSGKVVPLRTDVVQLLTDQAEARYRPMFVFGAATGPRPAELTAITWDRVTPTNGGGARVKIDRQLTRASTVDRPVFGPLKTEWSEREVGIGPETVAALGPRGEGLVFTRPGGRPILSYHASDIWTRAAEGIDLRARESWHALRHFHASGLIAGGASPVAVAHRLGHKDARETLRTYSHLWVDDDDRMRDATDGLIRLTAPTEPPAG